ncbi:hypothetical protein UFOVP695_25 [uncultured Caudovirales phage]|uniref:Uncharacterized protein n=1 Tax=uncultured Caudovirales phage TaxID=2100421 RepID=A0A6J5NHE8_9CAUD|nr:hypothetical protein UFOVP695_25 [uncultured Caudovirales phage]
MTPKQIKMLYILIKLSKSYGFPYKDLMKLYITENNLENIDFF